MKKSAFFFAVPPKITFVLKNESALLLRRLRDSNSRTHCAMATCRAHIAGHPLNHSGKAPKYFSTLQNLKYIFMYLWFHESMCFVIWLTSYRFSCSSYHISTEKLEWYRRECKIKMLLSSIPYNSFFFLFLWSLKPTSHSYAVHYHPGIDILELKYYSPQICADLCFILCTDNLITFIYFNIVKKRHLFYFSFDYMVSEIVRIWIREKDVEQKRIMSLPESSSHLFNSSFIQSFNLIFFTLHTKGYSGKSFFTWCCNRNI